MKVNFIMAKLDLKERLILLDLKLKNLEQRINELEHKINNTTVGYNRLFSGSQKYYFWSKGMRCDNKIQGDWVSNLMELMPVKEAKFVGRDTRCNIGD